MINMVILKDKTDISDNEIIKEYSTDTYLEHDIEKKSKKNDIEENELGTDPDTKKKSENIITIENTIIGNIITLTIISKRL